MTVVLNRIIPNLPPQYYKSFTMTRPLRTHWRPATCEEADCPQWLHGFLTVTDLSTELGQAQAAYIRRDRSRKHTEVVTAALMAEFTFPPGTPCFSEHRVPLERPPLFLVRGGDWRAVTSPVRAHTTGVFWAEEMQGEFDAVRTLIERG